MGTHDPRPTISEICTNASITPERLLNELALRGHHHFSLEQFEAIYTEGRGTATDIDVLLSTLGNLTGREWSRLSVGGFTFTLRGGKPRTRETVSAEAALPPPESPH